MIRVLENEREIIVIDQTELDEITNKSRECLEKIMGLCFAIIPMYHF